MSITESQNLSIHQLCEAIDLLDTCMDDYLYVYDFENDFTIYPAMHRIGSPFLHVRSMMLP